MNKSYKSIWNETLGTYVAASEVATSGGRRVSSGRKARRAPERALSSQIVLEQRIVFDAALPATVLDVATETGPAEASAEQTPDEPEADQPEVVPAATTTTTTAADEAPAAADATADADTDADSGTEQTGSEEPAQADAEASEPADGDATTEEAADSTATDDLAIEEAAVADTDERVEIIFVDAVAADVAGQLGWHPGEVYVLDADRDGLEQMAEILNGRTGIDAIHIISHGTPGRLELGNAALDTTSITGMHADELAIIRASLAEEADILLYGCDVSSSADGVAFVEALADATGADVAASSDDTGAEALGGDWVLETQVGDSIETTVIAATEWSGLLTTAVNVGAGAVLGTIGKDIYSIDLTTGRATLLTTVPATVGGLSTGTLQNSLAVNHAAGLIYYVSNDGANSNRALFAYDYINNVHILVDADLTSNGGAGNIAVGNTGVGSGGAVYANGALYFGVENNSGGDGGGTVSDDAIYRIVMAADGRSVNTAAGSVTLLVSNITGNDWGDLGYHAGSNALLSSDGDSLTRYALNAGGTSVTAT